VTRAFFKSARRFSAEPRQQPPVCSCGLLGGFHFRHTSRLLENIAIYEARPLLGL